MYHHPVHKISFIAQDMSDSRAFGYIFGSPDTGHRFFGIKTDKAASQVIINYFCSFNHFAIKLTLSFITIMKYLICIYVSVTVKFHFGLIILHLISKDSFHFTSILQASI